MQDQNIEKSDLTTQKMYELFSVKSVKTGFLNDPTTAQCSVYYKGKILASFYDPGCGGGVSEVNFNTDKAEQELIELTPVVPFISLLFFIIITILWRPVF